MTNIDLAKAASLKRHWKTAMMALIRRARDLGRIDERPYTGLNEQVSQKSWRKVEPVQIEHEQPTLIPQIIDMRHADHGYEVSDLARMTGLLEEEYSMRFGDRAQPGLRIVN